MPLTLNRRQFLSNSLWAVGAAAWASLLPGKLSGGVRPANAPLEGLPHFAPKAKRVIYLFMSGAPSQIDLFDYKPKMSEYYDKDLPESIRLGQRLTTMTSGQTRFPIVPSIYKFKQHGQSGAWISELLPHLSGVVDDLAIIKTAYTEAINHDPAITYIQTGFQLPGKASLGSWISYGLGSENKDLPAYIVMTCKGPGKRDAQALFSRLWGSGFLPGEYQGVALRGKGDPVLYLSDPPGVTREARRTQLTAINDLNRHYFEQAQDPEILSRVSQYEMAFRMQASVPDLTDLSKESKEIFDLYGPESRKPGTFAYSCLLARRLVERDVRCIQIFHRDWDHHGDLPRDLPLQCGDMDQPAAALIKDLKQRGLLKDTLVVWGGEFGRTIYCQGGLSRDNYGRDHHPRCFTVWMAGGGVKGGVVHGETDDFSYNIVKDPVHIRDLNATILHCMGIDHQRLTYPFQGLNQKLTGTEPSRVIQEVLI
jgi:uncharacterized protein (DUF1501 family)